MMQVDDLSSIDPNVDYTQILPIQQKRTVAFINHFVMNTVSFLNCFAQSCESRLMEFEYKLQKVEASLLILESQLSSISGLDSEESTTETPVCDEVIKNESVPELPEVEEIKTENLVTVENPKETPKNDGPVASEDSRFQKFFKMVQFGVPPPAVKLKMRAEGINPDILDTPHSVIPGFSNSTEIASDSSSNT